MRDIQSVYTSVEKGSGLVTHAGGGGRDSDVPAGSGVTELRLVVTAADYAHAVSFYRDALGLEQLAHYQHDGAHLTLLSAGRATIEIAEPDYAAYIDDVEVGRRAAGHIRIAFKVADTAASTVALVSHGASLVAEPRRTPWDTLNARLEAPGGLQLTLFSGDEEADQR